MTNHHARYRFLSLPAVIALVCVSMLGQSLPKEPLRIWLNIGTKEGGNAEEAQRTVDGARRLKETLIKKGWRPGKDLK